ARVIASTPSTQVAMIHAVGRVRGGGAAGLIMGPPRGREYVVHSVPEVPVAQEPTAGGGAAVRLPRGRGSRTERSAGPAVGVRVDRVPHVLCETGTLVLE